MTKIILKEWKPESESVKECLNCKHTLAHWNKPPCSTCYGPEYSHWEPKE